jgi:hypothetical protein
MRSISTCAVSEPEQTNSGCTHLRGTWRVLASWPETGAKAQVGPKGSHFWVVYINSFSAFVLARVQSCPANWDRVPAFGGVELLGDCTRLARFHSRTTTLIVDLIVLEEISECFFRKHRRAAKSERTWRPCRHDGVCGEAGGDAE